MLRKMIGEANTPVFSQLYKRINKLDVDIQNSNGIVTITDRNAHRMLAADSSGLKQHNRGEWMRAKWKMKRGFVKMHILVDTTTQKILALEVTDDTVGDSSVFCELLGQIVNAGATKWYREHKQYRELREYACYASILQHQCHKL